MFLHDPEVPRVLRIHPQRALTSVVFTLAGLGGVAVVTYGAVTNGDWTSVRFWFGFAMSESLALLFVCLGVEAWLTSVELSIIGNGQYLDIVRRKPGTRAERQTVALAEVTGVVIEVSDHTARLVIELREGRIPLTDTWTSDVLDHKAAALERFLGRRNGPVTW